MNLSEPFIRKPVMTTLTCLAALVFGTFAYLRLPTSALPDVAYPVITVTTSYPGASPQIMANNVATPLELQMMQIEGLELVTSENVQGSSAITLQFALNKSLDSASTDVQAAIQRAMGNLPADLPAPPSYEKTNPNEQPVIYLNLAADNMTAAQLYDYAFNVVAQRMAMLEGVSQANVYGSPRAVRVEVDPNAVASRNITFIDIADAVSAGNVFRPGGQLNGPDVQFIVDPAGQLLTADAYNNLIVAYQQNAPVFLRDIARAEESTQNEYLSRHYWVRGEPVHAATLTIAVTAAPGANAVAVAERVRSTLAVVGKSLPASIETSVIYDRSIQITDSIDDVKFTIVLAFALVVLVIFLFLGRINETLIPSVALPIALALTFGVMYLAGFSLDNLSLMALTLSVGFLVDDAIVVLENTVRHLEMGKTPLEAALIGAKEISFTVFSMTLSLAAVFLPLVFMSGLTGRMFSEFALTIVTAILMSGVVAITLSPMMCSRMLRHRAPSESKGIERAVNRLFGSLRGRYAASLRWILLRRWIAVSAWVASLAGTVFLFLHIPKTFLPVGDSSFIFGVFLAREGSSPAAMQRHQAAIAEVLQANPNLNQVLVITGLDGANFTQSTGLVAGFLPPPNQRQPIEEVNQQLRAAIGEKVPGVIPLFRPYPSLNISTGATSNTQGEYAYQLTSTDPSLLYPAANRMVEKLSAVEGFAQVSSDMRPTAPYLKIRILRDEASSYGVSADDIERTLQLAYGGGRVSQIKTALNQYDVIVETDDIWRSVPENLQTLRVRGTDPSVLVPLSAVAEWAPDISFEAINHINQMTSVTLFFNLKPGFPVGDASAAVERVAGEELPPGVSGSQAGASQEFEKTVASLGWLLIVAVFVMYVILGVLYESYVHPLTVLSTLPTAGVGGLLTLQLLNMSLSMYAYIGLFLLIGIVKKNGIMVVDFAIQRLADGLTREEAIVEACVERLRPILMTTFAAVLGAVPIASGFGADGSSRQPLGMCIIGGLLVAQVLTLCVTPVIYLYMEGFQEKVLDRLAFFQRELPSTTSTPAS